jgi:hypothetical protein
MGTSLGKGRGASLESWKPVDNDINGNGTHNIRQLPLVLEYGAERSALQFINYGGAMPPEDTPPRACSAMAASPEMRASQEMKWSGLWPFVPPFQGCLMTASGWSVFPGEKGLVN